MKKKILCVLMTAVMVLSVCAAAVPVRVQGQDAEPVLRIEAQNVSFRDSVYLKYAVSAEDAAAEDVTLLVWTQPQSDYTAQNAETSLTATGTATVGGKENCLVFEYKELAAKQMTDVIYVRAYTAKNGTDYYSAVKKYSILQYCYNMMGKTGTSSGSESLKTLLGQMLAYGAAAQNHFNCKTDALATADFYQVQVRGGLLSDACDNGLYLPGTAVTLTAPATDENGAAFARWENSAGASVGTTAELSYTVGTKNETLTAVYGAGESEEPQVTEPTITVEAVTAAAGADNVQVQIAIEKNPGVLGMVLKVAYDADAVTLVKAANGSALSALNYTAPKRFKGSGTNFTWYGEDISAEEVQDGVILTLTFSVPAGTAAGTYPITVSYSDGAIYDAELTYIDLALQNGSITVTE